MPAFSHEQRVHYFAHIPKCAGTTIEKQLEARFGPLALMGPSEPSGISLQHITWVEAQDWIYPARFASSFAVARHPLARFVSEYNMRISQLHPPFPREVRLRDFAEWVEHRIDRVPTLLDNHLRPQVDFIGDQTRVFRFEDGLESVVDWINKELADAAQAVPLARETHRPPATAHLLCEVTDVPRDVRERVERMYAEDYERFGYRRGDSVDGLRVLMLKPCFVRWYARPVWRARLRVIALSARCGRLRNRSASWRSRP